MAGKRFPSATARRLQAIVALCPLLQLPAELLHMFTCWLDVASVLVLRRTCRHMYAVTDDDAIWAHMYRLRAGVCDKWDSHLTWKQLFHLLAPPAVVSSTYTGPVQELMEPNRRFVFMANGRFGVWDLANPANLKTYAFAGLGDRAPVEMPFPVYTVGEWLAGVSRGELQLFCPNWNRATIKLPTRFDANSFPLWIFELQEHDGAGFLIVNAQTHLIHMQLDGSIKAEDVWYPANQDELEYRLADVCTAGPSLFLAYATDMVVTVHQRCLSKLHVLRKFEGICNMSVSLSTRLCDWNGVCALVTSDDGGQEPRLWYLHDSGLTTHVTLESPCIDAGPARVSPFDPGRLAVQHNLLIRALYSSSSAVPSMFTAHSQAGRLVWVVRVPGWSLIYDLDWMTVMTDANTRVVIRKLQFPGTAIEQ